MAIKFPTISVIIVSWNVSAPLKRCLDSIFATKYSPLEVIVVDNASVDNTISVVKKFSSVKLISNSQNIGLPKAINQGLRMATGDYLLQLNPDVVLPKDFFEKMLVLTSSDSQIGVVGPKFQDPDGTPQGSVFPEPSIIKSIQEFWLGQGPLTQKFIPESTVPVVVNCISGGCMFFPRATINKIGLFTESVFMYYEDLDYCRRVRQAGLKVIFDPSVSITHEHGASAKQSTMSIRYLNQSSRWYNGWLKYLLITLIIKTSRLF